MTILVRAAALQGYAELARACGVDPLRAMQRVRLSQFNLKDVDSLIPYVAFINLLEQTAQKSGCADFGLRLAQAQGIGVLGQLAVLFQHASNAGEALTLASRYIFVHSPAVQLEVRPVVNHSGLVDIVFSLAIPNLPRRVQILELSLGLIINGIRAVGQGAVQPRLVVFPHERQGPLRSYTQTMGCDCAFDGPCAAVRMDAAALTQPLPAHNPQLRAFAQQYLDHHFGDPAQHFGDRIRNMVRRFLSSGMGNQRDIASALSIHTRTLQRRLAAEGLCFEDMVDAIRKEQLEDLLKNTRHPPMMQMAMMLGYSDQPNLYRSCRRWYQCTPSALRKRLLDATDSMP
ncbi:MAG: AraC family transcriptional regulator ligand-binding domain-containing protein [Rhodoferax sp.]|nr:AraC family transcriptional regulator ligand-binding domain-containing protein [Rhodoferax sp.]